MDSRILASLRRQISDFPEVQAQAIETIFEPDADTLVVYFTADHTPTYWSELDDYLLLGRHADSEQVTGVMIEYFSEWLLLATEMAQRGRMLVTA